MPKKATDRPRKCHLQETCWWSGCIAAIGSKGLAFCSVELPLNHRTFRRKKGLKLGSKVKKEWIIERMNIKNDLSLFIPRRVGVDLGTPCAACWNQQLMSGVFCNRSLPFFNFPSLILTILHMYTMEYVHLPPVGVWMYDVPNRSKHLSIWSPVDGAVWAGYGFFRRCGIAGGSTSLGVGSESCRLVPFPVQPLCFLCVDEDWAFSFLSWLPVAMFPSLRWTLPAWTVSQINYSIIGHGILS